MPLRIGLAAVAVLGLSCLSACGGGRHVDPDRRHAQEIGSWARGSVRNARVSCSGASCAVDARTRVHSRDEAVLIAWPILAEWASDSGLGAVKRATLHLKDPRTGARATVLCRRSDPEKVPHKQDSRAMVARYCTVSWRAVS